MYIKKSCDLCTVILPPVYEISYDSWLYCMITGQQSSVRECITIMTVEQHVGTFMLVLIDNIQLLSKAAFSFS